METKAKQFVAIHNHADIIQLIKQAAFRNSESLILGGGSNILFTRDYEGLVIHSRIQGIEQIDEDERHGWIRVGSGVVWDDLVAYAVDHDLGGIENLSSIPGNVGASPIQNIGAYGVEVKDVIERVEAYDLETGDLLVFYTDDCQFGYRDSIFKRKYKNKLLVSHVVFRLTKAPHELITLYGTIETELAGYAERSIRTMREVVTKIRAEKLPDHTQIGNAGSFFKNPVIPTDQADLLRQRFPEIPYYKTEEGIKLSAAWLIDQSGLKGYTLGKAATHPRQPLVIVNTGNATGKEVLELARFIQKTVEEKFGVALEPEVNIL